MEQSFKQIRRLPPLSDEEKDVLINKATERPFTGKYCNFNKDGLYLCRQCGDSLYRSDDKFNSSCGWPSFDDEIKDKIKKTADIDGRRVEIQCANCGGHLGHVFEGEGFTKKNVRHCVNSASLLFIPKEEEKLKQSEHTNNKEIAIFAGGCFWGVEWNMRKLPGVISVESGFTGGNVSNPTYEQVCRGNTGHAEAVRIIFDPSLISYEKLLKHFMEIHDPTELNRQGPDIGKQYRSEIFYTTEEQKRTALNIIKILKDKGYNVVTKLTPATEFYLANEHHQNYYEKKHSQPYCHIYTKRFDS